MLGVRPVANMTLSASMVLPSSSVTVWLDQPLSIEAMRALQRTSMPRFKQLLGQRVAQVLVEAAQDLLAAVEQRGLGAEAVEDAGELHGDVAAADDHDRGRQRVEVEGLVGGDGVAGAGQVRHDGAAAGGDQDGLGRDRAVARLDAHRVAVDQLGAGREQLDARALQVGLVDAGDALDLLVLVGDQGRPVEGGRAQAPAEAFGVLELVAEAAGVDQQLLGDAAAHHAGAAVAEFLGDRHLGAVARGDARRAHAAGAGADHEQVEVEFRLMPHP